MPDGSALLSDFESWHAVLNRHYLAVSQADLEAFEAAMEEAEDSRATDAPTALCRRVEASWERIFALRAPSHYAAADPELRPIQATLWEIRRDQVRNLTPFVGR